MDLTNQGSFNSNTFGPDAIEAPCEIGMQFSFMNVVSGEGSVPGGPTESYAPEPATYEPEPVAPVIEPNEP